jgi:metal-responsive CopG/Arc/MetJ family transcriptional regulator
MSSTKISVSLDEPLAKEIRRDARASKRKVSTWLAEAAREYLRQKHARKLLEELNAEHGQVPANILDEVDRQWPKD